MAIRRTHPSLAALALAAVSIAALGLAAAAPVRAQNAPPTRRMGVTWTDGAPRVRFSAADLADRATRAKLDSGLPQVLVMRVWAHAADTEPVAVAARSCRVTFDLWEEVYRVEVQDGPTDRTERLATLDAVLERCTMARAFAVGERGHFAALRGRDVYFAVLLEVNPLSPDTVHRLRRWLARPAGGGRVGGDAFFGSFVSLFVNRQIGEAERTLRFRSQDLVVPR